MKRYIGYTVDQERKLRLESSSRRRCHLLVRLIHEAKLIRKFPPAQAGLTRRSVTCIF